MTTILRLSGSLAALALVLSAPLSARRAAEPVNGPIRVSDDGRYFVDRGGNPFFWLGDTAWPLFAEYTPEQAEAYLANRGEQGLHGRPGRAGLGPGLRLRSEDAAREHERQQARG